MVTTRSCPSRSGWATLGCWPARRPRGSRGQTAHVLGTMYGWCRREAGKLPRMLSCLLSALLSR
jgi:hypothetical protein